MKKRTSQSKNNNIVKMLSFSAAALSIVSFITTMNGLSGVVTDNMFFASLISFGIQSIILVMGLWFLSVRQIINNLNTNRLKKRIYIGLMAFLYFCSICFSSFFSYVYLSNEAYADVQIADYNMEIELFLNENTREIKNINNAIDTVLLNNIRKTAPQFRNLVEDYQQKASNEAQSIIGNISLYTVSVIPTETRFIAEDAINAYEGANRRDADNRLIQDCNRLETDINRYIKYYNDIYYPTYANYYAVLQKQTDASRAQSRIYDIQNTIDSMEKQITNLESFGYTFNSVEQYVKARCNNIISHYNFLIAELSNIINIYNELATHPDVIQGEALTLQKLYETIYSSNTLSQLDLDKTSAQLENIVSIYIKNATEIDETSMASLVACIEYLDELNQCWTLKKEIELFEKNNLNKTYIIHTGDVIEDNSTSDITVPFIDETTANHLAEQKINQVQDDEWSRERHKDFATFISLVKNMPDLQSILSDDQIVSNANDGAVAYLHTKSSEDYVRNTLVKAYQYSRATLENISSMERAWNYLFSQNIFLAVFCLLVSLFLDIASFLIGLYMHAYRKVTLQEHVFQKRILEDEKKRDSATVEMLL